MTLQNESGAAICKAVNPKPPSQCDLRTDATASLQKHKNAFVGSSFAAGEINRARERAERRLDEPDETTGRAKERKSLTLDA